MCLSKTDFEELCDLYPNTAESMKILGLKKRKMFLDCLTMQEVLAATGYKNLNTVVYKGDLRAHRQSQDDDKQLTQYEQVRANFAKSSN